MRKGMNMKIAIAAARLEHVKRGVETWAQDLFEALADKGFDVTLFKGSGVCRTNRERIIPSIKKGSRFSNLIMRLRPGCCWRIGLGSADTLEENSFAFGLIRLLRRNRFEIIHLQDAHVARLLQMAYDRGWIRTKVILGHGTEESNAFLRRLPFVQHLAPYHLAEALEGQLDAGTDEKIERKWFARPNFVDTDIFRPAHDVLEKNQIRSRFGLPDDAFVVLSVAAIKKGHKRIDHLIREAGSINHPGLHLVVAGACEAETDGLVRVAKESMGERAHFICDMAHDRIAEVFRMADVFALCSIKEMMPIALLEAIASGLPCLVHKYPVLEWMAGAGGVYLDMSSNGALSGTITVLMKENERLDALRMAAREHAVRMFSKQVVVDQIVEMYQEVMDA